MTRSNFRLTDAVVDSLLRDTHPYLSCDECFEQLDTPVERLLTDPGHQDIAMQVHLAACGACAEEAAALTELLTSPQT
jgi:hypothetical protein